MRGIRLYILTLVLLTDRVIDCRVIVSLTIQSYTNPNGTAYLDSSSTRKCCDGPQRQSCATGDTCDTYFDICLSSMGGSGCNGTLFHTKPRIDTNTITNMTVMMNKTDYWGPGLVLSVIVNDDDPAAADLHDHIDTLYQEVKLTPASDKAGSQATEFQWNGKTSLSLSLRAWCDEDYYGIDCNVYCRGLAPMAWCSTSTGKLTCSSSDEVLIEFQNNTTQSDFLSLNKGVRQFVKEQVCVDTNISQVNYPKLDPFSDTLSFSAYCGQRAVTALQLESLLNEKSDKLLDLYFPPGVIKGKDISVVGYGEHIVPNLYVGIEIVNAIHPDGTSYNGDKSSGRRRCCDIPNYDACTMAKDKCDMQFFVCVGKLTNGVCTGAITVSQVYDNTTSLQTCGPTLLDYTQGRAFPSHPMLGAMRLTTAISEVQVIVKDSDLGGNSSDIIDILGGLVAIDPGSDVTNATSKDISLKNIVSITMRLMFWCAPGHAGPLCKSMNGTDHCAKGWHGDDCSIPTTACSSNPCHNDATCISFPDGTFKCKCTEGYNGTDCDQDIDECALHVCQNGGTCQNLPGAFNCICPSGWDGLICLEKIPQCNPSPCYHGTCHPVPQSHTAYTCNCSKNWAGQTCNEKVACTQSSCIHGDCTTQTGDMICVCHEGYTGMNCSDDIDECQARPCKHGGQCTNTVGNFSCACPNGFSGHICDVTTVACPSVQCNNHGTCTMAGQAFICSCLTGYTGNRCEQRINLCQNVTCENNGTCTELLDGFKCNCTKFWSGLTCDADINECKQSPCNNNGVCTNTRGSYTCSCPAGWTGMDCNVDINECLVSQCKYGTCLNTLGSFKCKCNTGYFGEHCTYRQIFCKNVTCNGRGKCTEMFNGYKCNCIPGYHGSQCELDVDECSKNVCKNNATSCHNTPGSYNCTCAAGWTGTNCDIDFNECNVLNPPPCYGNGICHNTVGSFNCQCFDGFVGPLCDIIIGDCKSLKCLNNGSCFTGGDGSKCACASGWQGIRCETDKNECETDDPCQNDGACENTEGSYICNCYSGWTGNNCDVDIDECLSSVCQNDGSCTNFIGSFNCDCKHGWQGLKCEVHLTKSLKVALQNVQSIDIKADKKSWISSNWPIFVGIVAAVVAVSAVAFGCYRDRKNKRTTSNGAFSNPAFSDSDYLSSSDNNNMYS